MERVVNFLFCAIVVTIICAGALSFTFTQDGTAVGRENRKRVAFPPSLLSADFNRVFEQGVSDRLSVRTRVIDTYHWILKQVDNRGNGSVLIGKDGWLFQNAFGNKHNLHNFKNYQNDVSFTPQEWNLIRRNMQTLKEWCQQNKIQLYVVFSLDKPVIYSDKYPAYILKKRSVSLVSQVEALLVDMGINVVPLKEALLEAKKKDIIYYKTESHWNAGGAFVAYQLIMQEIQKNNPKIKGLTVHDFDIKRTAKVISSVGYGKRAVGLGNSFGFLNQPDRAKDYAKAIYPEYVLKNQIPIQTQIKGKIEESYNPKGQPFHLYMLSDSYGDYFFPFFAMTFREVKKMRVNSPGVGNWGIHFEKEKQNIIDFKTNILILSVSDLKLKDLYQGF